MQGFRQDCVSVRPLCCAMADIGLFTVRRITGTAWAYVKDIDRLVAYLPRTKQVQKTHDHR